MLLSIAETRLVVCIDLLEHLSNVEENFRESSSDAAVNEGFSCCEKREFKINRSCSILLSNKNSIVTLFFALTPPLLFHLSERVKKFSVYICPMYLKGFKSHQSLSAKSRRSQNRLWSAKGNGDGRSHGSGRSFKSAVSPIHKEQAIPSAPRMTPGTSNCCCEWES